MTGGSAFEGAVAEALVKDKCGTVACIAGWTCALLAPQTDLGLLTTPVQARAVLGLTVAQATALFMVVPTEDDAEGWDMIYDMREADWPDLEEITADQVVRVLDHLIETGRVDWSAAA